MTRWMCAFWILAPLALVACPPSAKVEEDTAPSDDADTDTDTDTDADTDTDTDSDTDAPTHALVATVAGDYSVGALATVALSDHAVSDTLAPSATDIHLVPITLPSGETKIVALNAYGYDSVQVFTPGSWSAPDIEFSVGDLANPHDAALCGDDLVVSLYGRDYLGVYDLSTGLMTRSIDLSAYDDGDGLPEASDLLAVGGTLYVALQQLDENNGWVAAGGAILALDCASGEVTQSWETGPSPSFAAVPGASALLVRTGVYYNEDYSVALDGQVQLLDLSTATLQAPLLTEDGVGENLTAVAAADDQHALVLSQDDASVYTIHCLDLSTGAATPAAETTSYLQGLARAPNGEIWVLGRPSWADPEAAAGIWVYDAAACTSTTGERGIQTALPPYAVAFY